MMGIVFRSLIIYFGYLYPALMCFTALNSTKPKLELLQTWCRFWIIMAVFTAVEGVADTFLSWVPLYSGSKLALVVYLWYPNTKGTDHIYEAYMKPFFCEHLQSMDQINLGRNPLNKKLKELCGQALFILKERVTSIILEQVLTWHLVASGPEVLMCEHVANSHPTVHLPKHGLSSGAVLRGNLTDNYQLNPIRRKGLNQILVPAIPIPNDQQASFQLAQPKVAIAELDDNVEADFEILDAHDIPVSSSIDSTKSMCTEAKTPAAIGSSKMSWFMFRWWRHQHQVRSDGCSLN